MTNNGTERGLQAERTAMAWTRTSFALLGNGVILLAKDTPLSHGPVRLGLAGFAAAVALAAYLVGRQRQRTLSQRPLPRDVSPRREVHLVGGLVLGLILIVALTLPR